MAMGLMHARVLGEKDIWRIDSSGVWAQRGLPPSQYTREVLIARGIDLNNYVSKPVTVEMVQDFNLILTMESNHREALLFAFPQHTGKIFMLTEMIGMKNDIEDPVGGSLADFEATARAIEAILEQGFGKISMLAAGDYSATQPSV